MKNRDRGILAFLLAAVVFGTAWTGDASAAQEIRTIHEISPDYQAMAPKFQFHVTSDEELEQSPWLHATAPAVPAGVHMQRLTVPADEQGPAVELSVYRPSGSQDDQKLPVVYYAHGGGYLFRTALYRYEKYQQLADQMQVEVVVPDYRISPEAPFPAALLDAYKGLLYVHDHGETLQAEPQIVLMGDSAGGGLMASLALYNRDHGQVDLAGEVLVYPMLDSRTGGPSDPYQAPNTGEVVWPRETNVYAWQKLQGGQSLTPEQQLYFSPAQAEPSQLRGLPPTLIYVGDMDLFVNEDISYANKLIRAGIKVEMRVERGLYHGFDAANPEAAQTKVFWQEVYFTIDQMLGRKR